MDLEFPSAIIRKFDTSADNVSDLTSLLYLAPAKQNVAEVTSHGVRIVDRFPEPTLSITVEPDFPEEFSVDDAIIILQSSTTFFGSEEWLRSKLERQLDAGVVIVSMFEDPHVVGSRLDSMSEPVSAT